MSLVEAKFVKREKRFFAHCLSPSGEPLVAHCANSGSMKGNLVEGAPVWLEDFGANHLETGRKLRYKWVLTAVGGRRVVVDTHVANTLVAEALLTGNISGFPAEFQREAKVGDSRLDFFFPHLGAKGTYLEVKSVSMGEGELSSFPDAVTERGQKHIRELMDLKSKGFGAVLFFLIMREDSHSMKPADSIDPEYGRLLREAVAAGVKILVYGLDWKGNSFQVGAEGKIIL